ncbi:hypothetical protein IIB50_01045 [Patescibacteria group bacterium]|nr:hypothetical protein [Patescibacteria group bacterium]
MPIDNETRRLLQENIEVNRENNKLLKKLHRGAVISSILRIVYVAIIIGAPVFLYYTFLQPYFAELNEVYVGVKEDVDALQSVGGRIFEAISSFFEKLGVKTGTTPN